MSIEVKGLTKIYGEQKAVNNISFQVARGQIVGFLGPNGAGKSTTMKILTGYLQQDQGTALVSGIDVKAQPIETKKRIGYLAEANPLYYEMYVREYLDFIAGIHRLKNTKSRIEHVIDITGLRVESKKKTGQLSKGYKQRVGLAAALIHDPEVLILDEPLNGADPRQRLHFKEILERLVANGCTIVLSSHILEEVEQLASTVLLVVNGKLAASGGFREIRAALNKRPYHVRVTCDSPRELAGSVVKLPSVDAVHVDPDGALVILSRNVVDLQIELPRLAKAGSISLRRVEPLDDSLESVFGYLVEN